MKSFMANPSNIERKWYVVDAADKTLGRLADKVVLTGKKLVQKTYFRHSGYLGGASFTTAGEMLAKNPVRMVELAVKGMIPHNRLGSRIFTKLHVYAGAEHPHAAQKPEVLEINVR